MKTIAIIGGGAAGMMTAVALSETLGSFENCEVFLFEKNTYLGAKVLISGGGRCNVTTGISDVRKLLENYPRGAKFLMSGMFRFPPEKVMEWFENHGVPLKTEDDLRVFPISNNGKDIVGAMENVLQESGVKFCLNASVVGVEMASAGGVVDGVASGPEAGRDPNRKFIITLKDGRKYGADIVVLTTGGNAYRHTGSTGDGYAFAKNLGHTLTPLSPSLNSFILVEDWCASVSGVSFDRVKLTLKSFDGQRIYERTGPFLFTHQGVSGPAVFALSSISSYEQYDKDKPLRLSINFFPDESEDELEVRIQKLLELHGKKRFVNFLDLLLPKSLAQIFVEILRMKPDFIVGRLAKDQRKAIVRLLHGLPLMVVGRGAGDEFVTAGGVELKEVHAHTLESKISPGLYFAGEILDVDGFTGGFNLQASWAMGRLVGESIAKLLQAE